MKTCHAPCPLLARKPGVLANGIVHGLSILSNTLETITKYWAFDTTAAMAMSPSFKPLRAKSPLKVYPLLACDITAFVVLAYMLSTLGRHLSSTSDSSAASYISHAVHGETLLQQCHYSCLPEGTQRIISPAVHNYIEYIPNIKQGWMASFHLAAVTLINSIQH